MGQLHNIVILMAIAVAAMMLKSTEAAEYIVGDGTGWISSPSGGASFYSDWASKITFKENDTLVFNFTSSHTVTELNDKASFDNCNVNNNKGVITTSPARITLNRTGEFYFACTVTGHCNSGQKLSVSITGSSTTPPSAQSPSSPPASGTNPSPPSTEGTPSPQSPTEPGSTPPPAPGSSSSVASSLSVLLIALLVNSLF